MFPRQLFNNLKPSSVNKWEQYDRKRSSFVLVQPPIRDFEKFRHLFLMVVVRVWFSVRRAEIFFFQNSPILSIGINWYFRKVMWEDNVGKTKVRRNKNSKPYERPKVSIEQVISPVESPSYWKRNLRSFSFFVFQQSILRRVTDSVTGLLPQPSWLVNWLQSTTPETQDAGNEDSEEEQPVPSTSSTNQETNHPRETGNRESFIFRRPPGALKEQSNGKFWVSSVWYKKTEFIIIWLQEGPFPQMYLRLRHIWIQFFLKCLEIN